MKTNKGFIGLLSIIIAAILIAGGGVYLFRGQQQTEQEEKSGNQPDHVSIEVPTGTNEVKIKMEGSPEAVKSLVDEARLKAIDAGMMANVSSVRTSAEIYWDTHGDYGRLGSMKDACFAPSAPPLFMDPTIVKILSYFNASTPKCNVSANGKAYAMWVKLMEPGKGYYCVDATGKLAPLTSEPPSGSTSCSVM